jgi:hypothetical protein
MRHLFNSSASKGGLLAAVIAVALLVVLLSAMPSAATPSLQGTIHKVYITNVTDKGFVASWTTQYASTGSVNYGTSTSTLSSSKADSLNPAATTTHYVEITGTNASTTYYFETLSDSTHDINGGAYYSVTTGPTLLSPPGNTLEGQVFAQPYPPGTPLDNAIVYFQVQRTSGNSQLMSSRTEVGGWWSITLGNIRTADFQSAFTPVQNEIISITAQGGISGTGKIAPQIPASSGTLSGIVLDSNPNAITLRSLTSRTESSVWVPVGLALLAAATTIMVVRKRRG